MNAYLLLPLIQTLFCLVLIFIVLKGHFRSFTHRLFSLFLLGLAIWGIIIFGMRASPDIEHAYLWEKWLIPLGPLTSVLFYHFTVRHTATRIKDWLIPLFYGFSILSIPLLATTDLMVRGMQIKYYGYAPILGPLLPLWLVFSYMLLIMALIHCVRASINSPYAEQRNRAAYITAGIGFMLAGVVFDFLPIIGLPSYPGLIIGNIVFCLLVTVAIVRHSLLDIHVIMRKGTAYVVTSAVLAVPFIAIFLLATKVFTEGTFPSWTYVIVAIVLAFALPHLWQRVQRWVDRWFYRDRYDYLKALEVFSQQTQSLTNSAELGPTMVNLLAKALRSSSIYLLQPLPPNCDFTTTFPTGVNNPTPAISLKKDSALIKWLERSNSMLSREDIDIIPQLHGMTSKERETLEQTGTKLIATLKAPAGQLSAVLMLGEKLSEQPYTSEDKQLIYTICNHMSTNLENARLYRESQQEVEERRRAEEALRESRGKYKLLFESTLDGMFVLDAETMKIVLANQAAADIYGLNSAEEAGEVNLLDFIPPEERERVLKIIVKDMFENDLRQVNEFRTITKDGREIWISAVGTRTEYQGKLAGLVSFRDITEHKQAEEREKELQRELLLSSRLASIGELSAGVAHQINNPLTGVLGFSQRLLRKSTDQEVSQDLQRIFSEAERAAKVVQNLLTFARRREVNKQYSDINEIVKSALELRAYELKTSNIEAVTDLASSLPQIMVDFYQIQETFLNIILNAEQAMTEANSGGRLTIKTEERRGYIRTTFTDDGPGIPAENLDKLFDPFFSTRGERGGTGLGLSVCHGIITEHSGRIYAKSKPGKGATFFVELPVMAKK